MHEAPPCLSLPSLVPRPAAAAPRAVAPLRASADAGGSAVYRFAFDIDFSTYSGQFVNCANNGQGEYVDTYGTLHAQETLVLDVSGGYHDEGIFSGQDTWAVGRTTGTVYRAPMANRSTGEVHPDGSLATTGTLQLRYIGLGADGHENSFFINSVLHYNFDSDGNITTSVERYDFICPGPTPDPVI